jgi:hypothetical protein
MSYDPKLVPVTDEDFLWQASAEALHQLDDPSCLRTADASLMPRSELRAARRLGLSADDVRISSFPSERVGIGPLGGPRVGAGRGAA